MASTAFPEILYNDRFWLIVLSVLVVAICLAKRRSPPPFPPVGKFFASHKTGITRAVDVSCVLLVAFWFLLFPLWAIENLLSAQSQPEPLRALLLRGAWSLLFMSLTAWSGIAGFFIGFLSVFQSDVTKIKRIFLLILCLFPVVFTVLHILTLMDAGESPWLAVWPYCSWPLVSWVLNAPAILVGRHFSQVLGDIERKVKSVFANRLG